MSFGTRARAEDPNISMRLIEKIKHKCQDYFRQPASPSAAYTSDLQTDILQFKKDCLVAVELAYQYIEKSLSTSPAPSSRSDLLKLEYELEKLGNENQTLQGQIESLKNKKTEAVDLDNLTQKSDPDPYPDQGHDKLISELQGQLVIQEMKFENSLSDLESANKELRVDKERLESEMKDLLRKNEILEKKVKESLNGYSRLIARKSTGNKEVQTGRVELRMEVGEGIEIQRSNDAMSQISKLSITESEIFDMTSMQMCDVHRQPDTSIKRTVQSLSLINYPCATQTFSLQVSPSSSLQILPIYKGPPQSPDPIPTQTDSPVLLLSSSSSFALSAFQPKQIPAQDLSTFKIFSFSQIPRISNQGSSSFTRELTKPTFSVQRICSWVKTLDLVNNIHQTESLACKVTLPEESKSKISRRKSTLTSTSDRKPAIEEYFSLVSPI